MGASRELSEFAGVVSVDSGNVGISTSSPEYRLDVTATDNVTTTTAVSVQNSSRNYGVGIGAYTLTNRNIGGTATTVDYTFDIGGILIFKTGNSERARIDASGNLLINSTSRASLERVHISHDGASQEGIIVLNTNTAAGTHTAIGFRRPSATTVGNITTTLSATAYVTSSDYRLKENIQLMTGALAKVAELKPCTYKWKVDGSDGQGFIAHELQEVFPDAVSGEKDAVNEDGSIKPQGIDTSFLVATLTAAIQELKAELDATKAKVTALEAK